VARVVGVLTAEFEGAPVDGPVVGVSAGSQALVAVGGVGVVGAHAQRVLEEYGAAEGSAVAAVVAALAGASALRFGVGFAVVASA